MPKILLRVKKIIEKIITAVLSNRHSEFETVVYILSGGP